MESLLDTLSKKETWEEFLEYKSDKNQLSKKEIQQLSVFIAEERYKEICKDFVFSYPVKKEIARMGSAKKRIVYSYSEDETWVLKLLAYKPRIRSLQQLQLRVSPHRPSHWSLQTHPP